MDDMLCAYPSVNAAAFFAPTIAPPSPPPPLDGPPPPPPPLRRQLTIAGPFTCPFADCHYVPEHKRVDRPCERCGRDYQLARRAAHDAADAAKARNAMVKRPKSATKVVS